MSQDELATEAGCFEIVLGLCRALWFLHTCRPTVVHGDLKSGNVLVDFVCSSPRAKLVDFGFSRLLTQHALPIGGTVRWMAPEVYLKRGARPLPSADVFSFGRLAFYVSTALLPYHYLQKEQLVEYLKCGRFPPLRWR